MSSVLAQLSLAVAEPLNVENKFTGCLGKCSVLLCFSVLFAPKRKIFEILPVLCFKNTGWHLSLKEHPFDTFDWIYLKVYDGHLKFTLDVINHIIFQSTCYL